MDACIVDAVRTPVGKYGGALSSIRPDDMAAVVLRKLVERAGIPPTEVEDVYLGCGNQAGEDNRNIARMSLLLAGFPVEVAGSTVNRLCASGMEAISQAARAISCGEAEVYVGGGVESMSRAPWAVAKPERAFPGGGVTMHDTALGWRFINPRMRELYGTDSMGETAENLVDTYGISREAQDRFALSSHRRAVAAEDEGRFTEEIVSISNGVERIDTDEGPRRNTSLEKLASLPPVFRSGGTVTAGNSSPLSDGAAALLVTSEDYAAAHGLKGLAKVKSVATVGVPPSVMGIGPAPASHKALKRAGLSLNDMGVIELNEAFAAQVLAVLKEWGVEAEDPRLNPNGGAIALGHPIGCSGARVLTTLVHEMKRQNVQFALATMCVGVGQGMAVVIENLG